MMSTCSPGLKLNTETRMVNSRGTIAAFVLVSTTADWVICGLQWMLERPTTAKGNLERTDVSFDAWTLVRLMNDWQQLHSKP